MSKNIPPLLNSSPPPINGMLDDDDDDEFGDFTDAINYEYNCEVSSLPSPVQHKKPITTPECDVEKNTIEDCVHLEEKDIQNNSNNEIILSSKTCDTSLETISENNLFSNVNSIYNSFQYFSEVPPDIVSDDETCKFTNNDNGVDIFSDRDFAYADVLNGDTFNDINITKELNSDTNLYISSNEEKVEIKNIFSESGVEGSEQPQDIPRLDVNNSEITSNINLEENDEISDYLTIQKSENDFKNGFSVSQTSAGTFTLPCAEPSRLYENDLNNDFSLTQENSEPTDLTYEDPLRLDQIVKQESETGLCLLQQNLVEQNSESFLQTELTKNQIDNVEAKQKITELSDTYSLRQSEDEDDFGDFNDYSVQNCCIQDSSQSDEFNWKEMCSLNSSTARKQTEFIIIRMFPLVEQSTSDYCNENFLHDDRIFECLKDVTDTSALLYQWSKSQGQKCLLNALNIDTRNILYGPRWNESMPRYAATLGFTPLEPVKSENLTQIVPEPSPMPAVQVQSNDQGQQNDIPSAEFDWDSSGLKNPLQVTPKHECEDISVKGDIIGDDEKKCFNSDLTLFEHSFAEQSDTSVISKPQCDNGSVKSLQLNDLPIEETTSKTIMECDNDFLYQQSSKKDKTFDCTNCSFNSITLRETHIANDDIGDVAYIKSNGDILESIPKRPATVAKDKFVNNLNESQAEDEFGDFQTSWMNTNCNENIDDLKKNDKFAELCSSVLVAESISNSSTNQTTSLSLEPLKPIVVQSAIPTSINWPDPGITDDDLTRFEFNYNSHSSKTPKLSTEPVSCDNKIDLSVPNSIATTITDDDDWSEFVSNRELANNMPTKMYLEQTACTKKLEEVNSKQHTFLPVEFQNLSLQQEKKTNSQINHVQNNAQVSTVRNNLSCQTQLNQNTYSQQTIKASSDLLVNSRIPTVSSVNDHDEEWTDFVSSKPIPTTLHPVSNSLPRIPKINLDWNRPPQFTSWSESVMPNIITNPVSFESFQNFTTPVQTDPNRNKSDDRNCKFATVQLNKHFVSNSSIPDLEFIAPRNKSWKK